MQQGVAEEAEVGGLIKAEGGLFYHEPACRIALLHLERVLVCDDAHEEQNERRSEQVQRRAADGLVGAEIDGREGQQQREHRAHDGGGKHREQLIALHGCPVLCGLGGQNGLARLEKADCQNADERAEDHYTFKGEVDDTASLGEHTCERDDHQGNREKHGLLDKECHASSPPFSVSALSAFSAVTAPSVSGSAERFFFGAIIMRITRANALR